MPWFDLVSSALTTKATVSTSERQVDSISDFFRKEMLIPHSTCHPWSASAIILQNVSWESIADHRVTGELVSTPLASNDTLGQNQYIIGDLEMFV